MTTTGTAHADGARAAASSLALTFVALVVAWLVGGSIWANLGLRLYPSELGDWALCLLLALSLAFGARLNMTALSQASGWLRRGAIFAVLVTAVHAFAGVALLALVLLKWVAGA